MAGIFHSVTLIRLAASEPQPQVSFDADGVWRQILRAALTGPPRPALFLDRDGVIVEEVNYLCRIEDVVVIPGACETIAEANRRGVPVVIVTNQAGIARGLYGWPEFAAVQNFIAAALAERGALIDGVYACAHHPDGIGPYAHPDHPSRKPRPGMLLKAAAELGLDLRRSWIVGDKVSDLEAGRAAGLAGGIHVLTGHGRAHREKAVTMQTHDFVVDLASSIANASHVISR